MAQANRNASISGVERVIRYTFSDGSILWEALHAPGANTYDIGNRNLSNGNKRLALFGDTVFKTVLIEAWYITIALRGSKCHGNPKTSNRKLTRKQHEDPKSSLMLAAMQILQALADSMGSSNSSLPIQVNSDLSLQVLLQILSKQSSARSGSIAPISPPSELSCRLLALPRT